MFGLKKKLLVTVLSFIMVVSILAGCSGNNEGANTGKKGADSSSKKIELTYWTLFAGGDGQFMQELIDSFNSSQSEIKVNNVVLEWGEYYTKLITAVSAGNGPDIGISHTSKLPELIEAGVATPVDDEAAALSLDWSSFNQNILEATVVDGKHYAVPIDTHPFIMYYNKKLLRDAGLLGDDEKPKIEPGADGFVSFLSQLKEKLPTGVTPYALANTGEPYRLWWALYHQLGGNDVISDDGKTASIDKPKAVQAAAYIKGLFDKGFIKPNDPDFYKTFQSQQSAIMTTGVWATGTWEATEGLEFGAGPIPDIYGNHKTWGDSHTIIIPETKKNDPEKRIAVLKFADYVASNGQIWAKAGHIPSKVAIIENEEFKKLKYRSDYVSVAADVAFPKASPKTWPKNDLLNKYLDEIWTGAETPEKGIDKIETEINALLSK